MTHQTRSPSKPVRLISWSDTNPDGWASDQYNRHGTISSSTTTAPADSLSSPLADFTYTYDEDGKRLSQAETTGSNSPQTTTYQYDSLGRLDQVVFPSGDCHQYSYDADSNRTALTDWTSGCKTGSPTTTSYTYNPSAGLDELTSVNSTTYTYTSDGQVQNNGNAALTWDGWGRLSQATVGSNTIAYTYDPTGALMQRTSSSPATTINYLLGDLFETNAAGTITTSYTDGPAGNLASYSGPPTGTPTYLYYDEQGNLVAEADSSGTLSASHSYDPFGAPTDSVPSNTTVHRFVGRWDKQYDTTTNLILMGARPYNPATGRFLAVDPIAGGSLNNYDYAGQDPINDSDLTGTQIDGESPSGNLDSTGEVVTETEATAEDSRGGSQSAEERGGSAEDSVSIDEKITRQMNRRGWTRESIEDTVAKPYQTHEVVDITAGGREPATAYVNSDGAYVVLNDATREVVQISNANDPDWAPAWDDPKFR